MKKLTAGADGISVEALLYTDRKSEKLNIPAAVKTLVAAAGAAGSAGCFLSCIDTGVKMWLAILIAVFSCFLFGTAMTLKGKYALFATAGVFAVYIAAVYRLKYSFCNGLANVMNIYAARVDASFRKKDFLILLSPESAAEDTGVFISLTVIFMSAVYCWGIVRHNSLPAVLAVSVPPVELCLYFGLTPDYAAFFAVIASWFAVFAADLSTPDNSKVYRKASSQCGLTAAAAVFLCGMCAVLFVQLSGYTRPDKVNEITDRVVDYVQGGGLEEAIEEIRTIEIIRRDSAINHGKLGDNGNITFSGETALEVTMPKTAETVYLRGFVGSVYTGDSWEQLPQSKLRELEQINGNFETEGMNSLLLSSYNLKLTSAGLKEHSFSVKNIAANDSYLYMPYNLVPESVSRYRIADDVFPSDGAESWFGRCYSDPTSLYGYRMLLNTAWLIPDYTLSQDYSSYRNFVYDNYLDIPDDFKAADEVFTERYYDFITAEAESEGKSTLTDSVVFGRKLYYIRSWLRDNCQYSLNAGKLPSGRDFADYFVTETKKGSCSHFSSAAVLLCRYAGIPARYVEGYVVKPADFDPEAAFGSSCTVDVTDARAHAWAEIFVDGFGWYPMEFTSGYGNIMTAVTTQPVTEEITESETEESTFTEVTEAETYTEQQTAASGDNIATTITGTQESTEAQPAVTSAPAQTEPANEQQTSRTEATGGVGFSLFGGAEDSEKKYSVVYDLTAVLGILSVLCFAVAFICIRRAVLVKRSRSVRDYESKDAVKKIYRRFRKLVRAAGLPECNGTDYGEYAEILSRNSLFADGAAERIIFTALKAEFGGDSLSGEEVKEMYRTVNTAVKKYLSGLNRFRRFTAEYIIGIV
ncbi:MAG: transglutaminase domain-containing protein [Oscillospiraceae bacterium]|nr:transglutaminase domain-containing protein [Oscillospiraceae bacterium]